MKKTILFLTCLFLAAKIIAQTTWTVQTVPNTRLNSNTIHVSDPDGYLSDSSEIIINNALCSIRDQVDVFLVTLTSIGNADTKQFATALFNHWGIGDSETNNGVLLLFVEEQHALEFETGYGAEETLTDALCQQIFTKTIVPYFKAGDYEGGLCAGVAEIMTLFGGEVPAGLKTAFIKPSQQRTENDDESDLSFPFEILFLLLFILPAILLFILIANKKNNKNKANILSNISEDDGVIYLEGNSTKWSGSPWEGNGCLMALFYLIAPWVCFGISIILVGLLFSDNFDKSEQNWLTVITVVLFLTWMCVRQNRRALKTADRIAKTTIRPIEVYQKARSNKFNNFTMLAAPWVGWIFKKAYAKRIAMSTVYNCPKCQQEMQRYHDYPLSETQQVEMNVHALKYMPYRCKNGHIMIVKEHGDRYVKFTKCPKCGAYTLERTKTENIREASYTQNGETRVNYECRHCGFENIEKIVIPMLVRYSSSSSSSSGSSYSRSSSSSSRSSSGSFGGGRSGGGGYSGRW